MPTIFWVGAALWLGYYLGQLCEKLNLPALIGHMLLGVILGPSLAGVFLESQLQQLNFIIDLGLGLVAFLIGTELHPTLFKRMGWKLLIIVICETTITFILVYLGLSWLNAHPSLAAILAAIAAASAPAGTVAVIQSCRAKGALTKIIYAVVGIDDAIASIMFGLATAFAMFSLTTTLSDNSYVLHYLFEPVKEVFLSLLIGAALGFAFQHTSKKLRHPNQLLIFMIAAITLAAGVAAQFHLSLILATMMIGLWMANFAGDHHLDRVRKLVNNLLPAIFILFFVLAGAHLDFSAIGSLGLIGLTYFFCRCLGKWLGGYTGAWIADMPGHVRNNLGSAILCQAGLAVGLALLIADKFNTIAITTGNYEAAYIGKTILSTVTTTTIFFEVIGPILTRRALAKAGNIHHSHKG